MEKWAESYSELLEKTYVYKTVFTIDLKGINYTVSTIIKFKNDKLYQFKIVEAIYKDEMGKFLLDKNSVRKLTALIRKNIIGSPEIGICLNRPLSHQLRNFVPQAEESTYKEKR